MSFTSTKVSSDLKCRSRNSIFPPSAAIAALFSLGGEQEKQETLEQWILETGVELLPQSIAIAGLCEKCREDLKDENASPADQGPFGRPGHCPRRRRFRGGTPG